MNQVVLINLKIEISQQNEDKVSEKNQLLSEHLSK